MGVDGAQLELQGSVTDFANPGADLAVSATIDAAHAANIAHVDEWIGGRVTVHATAKGPLSSPAIEGHIRGSALTARSLPPLDLEASARYDFAARAATVSAFDVRAPWGRAEATGVLRIDSGPSRVRARLTDIDLAVVMRSLDLPYRVASRVDARVDAEWPALEYLAASGHASVGLSSTERRVTRSTIPLRGRVDATARSGDLTASLTKSPEAA